MKKHNEFLEYKITKLKGQLEVLKQLAKQNGIEIKQ